MSANPAVARSRGGGDLSLCDVGADNWRACVELEVAPDQRAFVGPVSRYLVLCHYGEVWHPLAIHFGSEVVGFVMWAIDDEDGSGWIGGLTIDQVHQRRGYGRAAVTLLSQWLADEHGCPTVALSYSPDNEAARRLYSSVGFVETGEKEDDEVVARKILRSS